MRALQLGFALIAYLLFFIAFLYLIGFVGNLVVPRSIDSGPTVSPGGAVLIDALLITLFGLQHSVMARPGFKSALTRHWPAPIERSLYVLMTVAVLVVLFLLWQPIPALVWSAGGDVLRGGLWALFALGWTLVFVSTWLLNHFELFGLQQAWHHYRGTEAPGPRFRTPLFYNYVRHPLYLGFVFALWAIPDMSQGHLLLAAGLTLYILIAIRYEERDLTAHLGEQYAEYRKRVGMLIPGIGRAR